MPHATGVPSTHTSRSYYCYSMTATSWATDSSSNNISSAGSLAMAGPPYPRSLDLPTTSPSPSSASSTSSSAGANTAPPLMAYSTSFTKDWPRDFGSGSNGRSWSTTAQKGSDR
ncbi:hypothetical protein F5Y17DRAFT_412234 [Xylariaceae sp. FL0594]|nr:hypothetical protein F5Y17DRAFT_412234 [Xylariaceae sp. FL0594]